MVTCGICHEENLTEIGELDSCDHSFCSACIQHWAQIESKCPFCKARFTSISRKVLDLEKLPDSDAESDDTVRQRFPGTVLDTFAVPERNQVYLGDAEWAGEGEGEDPLGDVVCMECGRGDDEDNLMLCDGCERACHTYCANLDALPEGDWFCWVCQENRDRQLAGEAVVDLTAARRPQRSTRSNLVASDFTLPRRRRRASSPGARSELSRTRRVRRRLVRSGDGLQPQRSGSGSQHLGGDADSILNALERSISARDHAGLSTTTEHRRLAGLRGAWNSVRQGYRPFPATAPPPPPTQAPVPVPQAVGSESQAWAAFEASRRAQDRTGLRAPRTSIAHPSGVQATLPGSPPVQAHSGQQSASSLARQAVAEARSRGRRLGPTGRQLSSPNPRAHPPQLSSSSTLTVASERRRAREAELRPPTSPRLTDPNPRASLPHHLSSSVAPFARIVVREDEHQPPRSPHLRQRLRTPEELQRRRARGSSWQERSSDFPGSDKAGSAGGRRAALYLDRHHPQPRSSSSAQASLPRDASHMHGQTDAGQTHAHPLHWRSTDNATDNSSSAAPAASADVNIQNPNLVPVPQRWLGRPASPAQPPQQWGSNPGSHQHLSWHTALQAQQPVWATAPPAAFEASHSRSDLAHGQPAGLQSDKQHTLRQQSLAPLLPPDGAAQTQSNPDEDGPAIHVAQPHGHDREEDSSDSSTSQLASQRHAAQGLQATHMAEVSGSQHHAHGSRDVAQRSAGAGRDPGAAAISQAASEPRHRMTKQEAADAVKKLIKPLYAAKKLSKDEFKAVAQKCTHSLANDQTAAQDVHTIVKDCMKLLGLTEQSAFL